MKKTFLLAATMIFCFAIFVVAQTNLGGGGGTPGGSNTQVQYNNNGAFGGTTATWDTVNNRFLAPNGASGAPAYSFTNGITSGMRWNGSTQVIFTVLNTDQVFIGSGSLSSLLPFNGPAYQTATNCSSSASPAVCGSAAAGMFVLPAAATSVTVNTTAVTANSEIIVFNDDSLGTRLSVTCNTSLDNVLVTARVPATSFTITGSAPVTNPNCYSYIILN